MDYTIKKDKIINSIYPIGKMKRDYPKPYRTYRSMKSRWSFNLSSAVDDVGANNGTVTDAVVSTGKIGKGYYFDGTNDYIVCGDINEMDGATEITLVSWAKPELWNNSTAICNKASTIFMGKLAVVGLAVGGFAISNTVPAWIKCDGDAGLTLNEWNFCVGKKDANFLYYYLNGVKKIGDVWAGTPISTAGTFRISDATYDYKGWIDEVMFFNCALTDHEIQGLYEWGCY